MKNGSMMIAPSTARFVSASVMLANGSVCQSTSSTVSPTVASIFTMGKLKPPCFIGVGVAIARPWIAVRGSVPSAGSTSCRSATSALGTPASKWPLSTTQRCCTPRITALYSPAWLLLVPTSSCPVARRGVCSAPEANTWCWLSIPRSRKYPRACAIAAPGTILVRSPWRTTSSGEVSVGAAGEGAGAAVGAAAGAGVGALAGAQAASGANAAARSSARRAQRRGSGGAAIS
ncbi:MAG TPA: hypothetical protein VII06_36470 [Chloroflexota bacterium]